MHSGMHSDTALVGSSRFRWVALYGLCFIAVAAALRRIVVLVWPGPLSEGTRYAYLDAQFASHRALTFAHIVPALVFVVLLPFWFSARVRQSVRWYRRLGWALFVLGGVVGITALPMAAKPVGGMTELTAVLVFDSIYLFSLVRASVLFARREMDGYREWMMRAVSVLLGIATTRPVMGVFFATAPLTHLTPHEFFGIAFWIGFGVTYLAGEAYLRKHPVTSTAPARS